MVGGFLFVGNSCSPVRDFDTAGSKLEVPQEEVGLSAEGFEGVQESSLQLCGEVLELGRAWVGQVVVPGYVGDPEVALKCVLNCKIRVRISFNELKYYYIVTSSYIWVKYKAQKVGTKSNSTFLP